MAGMVGQGRADLPGAGEEAEGEPDAEIPAIGIAIVGNRDPLPSRLRNEPHDRPIRPSRDRARIPGALQLHDNVVHS